MILRHIALLIYALVITYSNFSFAHVLERPSGTVTSEFHEPHEVIEIYLKAVSRGELMVFGQQLTKSMLTPIRVEYVYELTNAIPRIKVYSELKTPLPVPAQADCKIRGVSAILNADGRIVETQAHIWTEQ